jgi:hypothetical protein
MALYGGEEGEARLRAEDSVAWTLAGQSEI